MRKSSDRARNSWMTDEVTNFSLCVRPQSWLRSCYGVELGDRAHRLGHEIWALVSPAHRESIKRACDENPDLGGIRWIFPEVKGWPLKQAIEPKWERTYNLLWQRAAVPHARDLHRQVGFDLIHHLTWAGIRAPTFLGALTAPLVIGPIGGGETSPPSRRAGELARFARASASARASGSTSFIFAVCRRVAMVSPPSCHRHRYPRRAHFFALLSGV